MMYCWRTYWLLGRIFLMPSWVVLNKILDWRLCNIVGVSLLSSLVWSFFKHHPPLSLEDGKPIFGLVWWLCKSRMMTWLQLLTFTTCFSSAWGGVTMCMAATTDFAGLIVCRLFMGFFEAGKKTCHGLSFCLSSHSSWKQASFLLQSKCLFLLLFNVTLI